MSSRGHTAKWQPRVDGKFGPIHGMRQTPTGSCWISMVGRCYNVNHTAYESYGGKGIFVCPFLKETPRNVVLLIGLRPSLRYSIDRYPNNRGNYTCGQCHKCKREGWQINVRWATRIQQGNNTKSNILIIIQGVRKTATEWARRAGIETYLILKRLRRGVTGKALLAAPNKPISISGVDIQRSELCKKLGIGTNALGMRLARGWKPDELLLPRQKPRKVHVFYDR